ncbi:polysaccharide deacetylase family protein [Dactylosporangium sp. NPDC049742]|uniref:polysaccharide deacetylase family protein n=1 Tax=Dactylosporangium sp. NPDC049742 TaxID=3154737 RepID=UPI003422AC4B
MTHVDSRAGNGYVALTYDDGPNPATTGALLDALRSAGVRATCFNVGRHVQAAPALARAQRAAGMWVANHSWTHGHLTRLGTARMTSELARTQRAVRRATGTTPRLFRPPYGETNAALQAVASGLGLTEVLWSVDTQDWNGAGTDRIVRAASTLQPGGVLLMHDGHQATIDAVPQIVADLTARGLRAGMISTATGRAVAPDGSP